MKREHLSIALFFLVSAIFFYLFYQIIVPFFVPICWAAVFVIVFFPLYERLLKKTRRPGLTSVIMCALIIALIIGPITYLFIALVNEASDAVTWINEMYRSGKLDDYLSFDIPWLESSKEKLSQYFDMSKVNLDEIAKDAIDRISGVVLNQTSWLLANGAKAAFYFFLMIFSMFYFFRDGERIVVKTKRLMPFQPDVVNSTVKHLNDVVTATMYGGVAIALLQGILGGIMFVLVGLPSPVFWGAIMAFLAIIPLVGAFIVYLPAGLILILGGSYVKGIIVIAVGSLVISQTDNIVRPLLISGKAQMHPLLLFFSILGGIALFGLLGLVLGPLIAAVFVTLVRILEMRMHPSTAAQASSPVED